MATVLSASARQLLDSPNFAHLATLMPDGSPKVDPVWVMREASRLLVTSDAKSVKVSNVEHDARVSMSVIAFDNPYEQLLIRGVVIQMRSDADLSTLDAFAEKYVGAPFPRRDWSVRVVLVVEPAIARYYRSKLTDPRVDAR